VCGDVREGPETTVLSTATKSMHRYRAQVVDLARQQISVVSLSMTSNDLLNQRRASTLLDKLSILIHVEVKIVAHQK